MDNLISDIDSFLNTLSTNFPHLLDKNAAFLFENPDFINDCHMICFHNNSLPIIHKLIYHIYNISNIRENIESIGENEIEYSYSNKHIEVDMTENHMQYTKSIIKNQNINQNKFIILINNCNVNNRKIQTLYKRMFEKHTNAIFIFVVPSLSYLSPEIVNMCCCINCKFSKEKVCKYISSTYAYDINQDYDKYNNDIINMILAAKYNVKKNKVEETLEKFFENLKKAKNGLELVTLCRDLSHKVFHLNMPLTVLAKYIIRLCPPTKTQTIIEIAAECDVLAAQSKKNILLYERFLIAISQAL